jgi:hypothetical protein
VPEILQINCTNADFFASQKSFDTYLYFNPYDTTQKVNINLGEGKYHLYDLNTQKVVKKNASKITSFLVSGQSSTTLVLVPANLNFVVKDGKLYAGDVIVDYRFTDKL